MVARRSDQAGDDQLPDVQAGARRAVLREDFRPGHRLGVPLRQVQADEAPRRHLRQVRRRGHAGEGAARAARSHPARHAGQPRLVLQGAAEPDRPSARSVAARSRAHPVFRGLRRHRCRRDGIEGQAAPERRAVPPGAGEPGRQVQGADGRRGHQGDAAPRQRGPAGGGVAREDAQRDVGAEEAQVREAAESRRCVPAVDEQAGVDDSRRRAGDSARAAPARAARWRPVRDLRPERSVPARHQPEQPAEEAHAS